MTKALIVIDVQESFRVFIGFEQIHQLGNSLFCGRANLP